MSSQEEIREILRSLYELTDEYEKELADKSKGSERDCLLNWIQKTGASVTARDVQRGFRPLKRQGLAEKALSLLVKDGLGRWEESAPGPCGGRPTRRFVLN